MSAARLFGYSIKGKPSDMAMLCSCRNLSIARKHDYRKVPADLQKLLSKGPDPICIDLPASWCSFGWYYWVHRYMPQL